MLYDDEPEKMCTQILLQIGSAGLKSGGRPPTSIQVRSSSAVSPTILQSMNATRHPTPPNVGVNQVLMFIIQNSGVNSFI